MLALHASGLNSILSFPYNFLILPRVILFLFVCLGATPSRAQGYSQLCALGTKWCWDQVQTSSIQSIFSFSPLPLGFNPQKHVTDFQSVNNAYWGHKHIQGNKFYYTNHYRWLLVLCDQWFALQRIKSISYWLMSKIF